MVGIRQGGAGKTGRTTHVYLRCVIYEELWVLETRSQASRCLLRLAKYGIWYARSYRIRTRLHIDVGGTVEDESVQTSSKLDEV